jgi:CMP/dCMP kinase
MLIEHTNLIVMGWVSSGSTTTALILSNVLKMKFVYAGGMYKRLASEMGYDPKSPKFIEFEEKYGEKWDWLWENYLLWKLSNENNLIVNAKIVGFLVDQSDTIFSSFVVAPVEIRGQRASGDDRTEIIADRDQTLQKRWKKVFGIDFLDIEDIKHTHDFVVDNNNLTIAQTAFEIYNSAKRALKYPNIFTLKDFEKEEKLIQEIGTAEYYKILESQNLLISHQEIANDWTTKFQKQLSETSPEWQEAVRRILG